MKITLGGMVSINVKIIKSDESILTIPMDDDPSDPDISRALGGCGDEPRTHLVTILGWDIYGLPDKNDFLVIGTMPYTDSYPKRRRSCNLDDIQLKNLIQETCRFIESAKKIIG